CQSHPGIRLGGNAGPGRAPRFCASEGLAASRAAAPVRRTRVKKRECLLMRVTPQLGKGSSVYFKHDYSYSPGTPNLAAPRRSLTLDGYLYRRRLDLPIRPTHHSHGDLGYARTRFVGDPHGAMEGVPSAPLLEQILATQRRGVGRLR